MSWTEVMKAVNNNLSRPLNKQLQIMAPQLLTMTKDGTFIAPYTGEYRVTCIGAGGNGAAGAGYTNASGSSTSPTGYGAGGVGGGSGGVAQSILSLTSGQQIACTVNTSTTNFGGYLAANAGSGQSGGAASGGNVFNMNGITGGAASAYNGGNGANCPWCNGIINGGRGATTPVNYFVGSKGGDGGKGYFPWPLYFNNASGYNDIGGGLGGPGGTAAMSSTSAWPPGTAGGVALIFPFSSQGVGGRGGDGNTRTYGAASGGGGGGGGGFFGAGGGGGGGCTSQGQSAAAGNGGAGGTGAGGLLLIEFIIL